MNVTIKNTITFKRLNSSCLKYEIYYEYEGKKILLDTISNYAASNLIPKRKSFEYKSSHNYYLTQDMYFDYMYRLKVYLNNIELKDNDYVININEKSVLVLTSHSAIDDLSIEYYEDCISYEHVTNNNCKYSIVPIFKTGTIKNYSVLE